MNKRQWSNCHMVRWGGWARFFISLVYIFIEIVGLGGWGGGGGSTPNPSSIRTLINDAFWMNIWHRKLNFLDSVQNTWISITWSDEGGSREVSMVTVLETGLPGIAVLPGATVASRPSMLSGFGIISDGMVGALYRHREIEPMHLSDSSQS